MGSRCKVQNDTATPVTVFVFNGSDFLENINMPWVNSFDVPAGATTDVWSQIPHFSGRFDLKLKITKDGPVHQKHAGRTYTVTELLPAAQEAARRALLAEQARLLEEKKEAERKQREAEEQARQAAEAAAKAQREKELAEENERKARQQAEEERKRAEQERKRADEERQHRERVEDQAAKAKQEAERKQAVDLAFDIIRRRLLEARATADAAKSAADAAKVVENTAKRAAQNAADETNVIKQDIQAVSTGQGRVFAFNIACCNVHRRQGRRKAAAKAPTNNPNRHCHWLALLLAIVAVVAGVLYLKLASAPIPNPNAAKGSATSAGQEPMQVPMVLFPGAPSLAPFWLDNTLTNRPVLAQVEILQQRQGSIAPPLSVSNLPVVVIPADAQCKMPHRDAISAVLDGIWSSEVGATVVARTIAANSTAKPCRAPWTGRPKVGHFELRANEDGEFHNLADDDHNARTWPDFEQEMVRLDELRLATRIRTASA